MAKDFLEIFISLKLQFPYQHKAMQRRRKISTRSKGFLILQQKCSIKFLNLLKLTLSKELNVQRTLFYRTKGYKTQQKCQMHWSEVVEAHFSSREAQCRWERCMVVFLVQQIQQNLDKLTQQLFREMSPHNFWLVPGNVPPLWLPCCGLCTNCTLRGIFSLF